MDNEQNITQTETVVENNGGADASTGSQSNDDIAKTVVEKIKDLFKKDIKQEETKEDGPSEEVLALAKKLAQEEIDKLAAKTKRKVTEDAQTSIEQEKANLEAEKASLQAEKQALALEKQFNALGIPEQFKEFIKFELQKSDKSLDDYIKENPQYKVNSQGQTRVTTNIKSSLTNKDVEYLKFLKENEK